jgi:uncharacterized membrane protein
MDSRTIAWVSYLTLVGWIIALVSHSNSIIKSSLAVFHLRQSFGLMVLSFVIAIIRMMLFFTFPLLGTVLFLAVLVLWVLGLISAVNGEEKPLPVVGPLFQQWFTFIK